MPKTTTIEHARAWITTLMIAVIGWFAKEKMQSIDDRLASLEKGLPAIQVDVATNRTQISQIIFGLTDLNTKFVHHVDVFGKVEDEITLEKLIKKQK